MNIVIVFWDFFYLSLFLVSTPTPRISFVHSVENSGIIMGIKKGMNLEFSEHKQLKDQNNI